MDAFKFFLATDTKVLPLATECRGRAGLYTLHMALYCGSLRGGAGLDPITSRSISTVNLRSGPLF